MNQPDMKKFGEQELYKITIGVDNLKNWIVEFLHEIKTKKHITEDNVLQWFVELTNNLNIFHAIINNFVISISRFVPIKKYNDGVVEVHDHVIMHINKIIDMIINIFNDKFDEFKTDVIDIHKNDMDSIFTNAVITIWTTRIQQITRDLLTKLSGLEFILINTKTDMLDLYVRNGARRPSQHEETMYQ